ncbi:hypothetical protein CICLE_v10029763mg [Citrus x clementina]|uniref:Uncharacterized protein n=1 Tax=Citrus clementina TaxID=85681 RepID=V4RQX0_CITCL|nr:hypothetical protein CICLE_v10029763mg [Citrus x clementina]ESR36909.1 hypothetical protein CICLE_v10029763mg [Citrus x clementina]
MCSNYDQNNVRCYSGLSDDACLDFTCTSWIGCSNFLVLGCINYTAASFHWMRN